MLLSEEFDLFNFFFFFSLKVSWLGVTLLNPNPTAKYALLSETTSRLGPDGLSRCSLHLFEESIRLMFNKTSRRDKTVKVSEKCPEERLHGFRDVSLTVDFLWLESSGKS